MKNTLQQSPKILKIEWKPKKKVLHAIFWCLYIGYKIFYLYSRSKQEDIHAYPLDTITYYLTLVGIFYGYLIFVFPYTIAQKKRLILLVLSLFLFIIFGGISYIQSYPLQLALRPGSEYVPFNTHDFFLSRIWMFMEYTIFAWGYWFVEYSILKTKENARIENEKIILETETIQAQLAFLWLQFNPHFLYNTLNFIYSRALRASRTVPEYKQTTQVIAKLSDIMQYSVKNHKDNKVTLTKEIQYLHNYMDIHQLKAHNSLQIVFETQGDTDQKQILPLTLISFVENAFKHGDLTDPEDPLTIQLSALNGHIDFMIRNRKAEQRQYPSTGIGIQNIKKRLDLTYGENYSLTAQDEPKHYITHLHIYD